MDSNSEDDVSSHREEDVSSHREDVSSHREDVSSHREEDVSSHREEDVSSSEPGKYPNLSKLPEVPVIPSPAGERKFTDKEEIFAARPKIPLYELVQPPKINTFDDVIETKPGVFIKNIKANTATFYKNKMVFSENNTTKCDFSGDAKSYYSHVEKSSCPKLFDENVDNSYLFDVTEDEKYPKQVSTPFDLLPKKLRSVVIKIKKSNIKVHNNPGAKYQENNYLNNIKIGDNIEFLNKKELSKNFITVQTTVQPTAVRSTAVQSTAVQSTTVRSTTVSQSTFANRREDSEQTTSKTSSASSTLSITDVSVISPDITLCVTSPDGITSVIEPYTIAAGSNLLINLESINLESINRESINLESINRESINLESINREEESDTDSGVEGEMSEEQDYDEELNLLLNTPHVGEYSNTANESIQSIMERLSGD